MLLSFQFTVVDEVVLPLASALTQACPDVIFKLPEYGEVKEVPEVPLLEVPEDPDVPVDPELPEDPLVPVDPDVPEAPDVPEDPDVPEVLFTNGECPEITSISNQGYVPIVLKSVLPPKLVKLAAANILYDIIVVPVVVRTASDIPIDDAYPAPSPGAYNADKLPIQDDVVSLYQQKVGLEFIPLFITVGI